MTGELQNLGGAKPQSPLPVTRGKEAKVTSCCKRLARTLETRSTGSSHLQAALRVRAETRPPAGAWGSASTASREAHFLEQARQQVNVLFSISFLSFNSYVHVTSPFCAWKSFTDYPIILHCLHRGLTLKFFLKMSFNPEVKLFFLDWVIFIISAQWVKTK